MNGARLLNRIIVTILAATFLAVASSGFAVAGIPDRIVVYTISTAPVTVPRNLTAITTVINLDRIPAIEEQVARGLHRMSPGERPAAAKQRLADDLQTELKTAWQALFRIRQGNITHLPAIVLDDRAVWYGSDLRRALTRYRNQRNAEGGS